MKVCCVFAMFSTPIVLKNKLPNETFDIDPGILSIKNQLFFNNLRYA